MINLPYRIDDAKCFQTVRDLRWPDAIACPHCSSTQVIQDGKDDTQPHRQRYDCHACSRRFDDLTGTIFAGHHQPLQNWILYASQVFCAPCPDLEFEISSVP